MLVFAYIAVLADLFALGGSEAGWVRDAVVQKIDRDTGTLDWILGGTASDFTMDNDVVCGASRWPIIVSDG